VMVGQSNTENERKLMSVEWRLVDVEEIVGYLAKTVDGLVDLCLKVDEWQQRSEEVTEMRMLEQFIEQEKRPSMDQEDMRETQQPWWKRTKEEVDSSSSELGHGEWSYDPELERLMEECEGKISSSVPFAYVHNTEVW
jgi:hypothetical protein